MTARYVEGWGRRGDIGKIAQRAQEPAASAAWCRLFDIGEPGYGFIAADVPELSLAVADEARGQGVGTALLQALIADVANGGYRALSLSVDKDNRTLRLYERLGFTAVAIDERHQTMLLDLARSSDEQTE